MTRAGNHTAGGSLSTSTTSYRTCSRSRTCFLVSGVTRLVLIVKYTLKLRPMVAIKPIFKDDSARGMSAKYDKADWIGGFPFEFATFELLVDYFESRGFALIAGKENPSLGCHELSFQRSACAD